MAAATTSSFCFLATLTRPQSLSPRTHKSPPPTVSREFPTASTRLEFPAMRPTCASLPNTTSTFAALLGAGLVIVSASVALPELAASAAEFPSLPLREPDNALSLPTWAIHVSSVVEWITAMALVWQYGEKSGFESWKGLSWGMVPLLGGAFCACTWHFFYNSESLQILVALQAALTVIGNMTMCIAAFRIYKSSQGGT